MYKRSLTAALILALMLLIVPTVLASTAAPTAAIHPFQSEEVPQGVGLAVILVGIIAIVVVGGWVSFIRNPDDANNSDNE